MKHFTRNLCSFIVVMTCAGIVPDAHATVAANPRGGTPAGASNAAPRTEVKRTTATADRAASSRNTVSRVATTQPSAQNTRAASTARSATGSATVSRGPRVGTPNVSRAAVSMPGGASARSAVGTTSANMSRAGIARATAVFSDVSKIGGGYAACRDSYSTCMDQFCANANDTYRRCFCSDKFTEFRNTEDAMDRAKTLLIQFQDNNLNAVDKTAAEVNAMYTATAGEQAIKKDVSGASKLLNQISDLLSGKSVSTTSGLGSTSLGILSFDFSTDMDDIWSGGDSNSLFGGSASNFADLEGTALYNAANKQCLQVIGDSCESNAVLNMARSSYSILITQDCNAYQKSVNSKTESIKQTVRTAEKYLREARLEEYRTHNSADVNECITKVRAAITDEGACGANYKRCLDNTGVYINQSTGEPIYSPRLFQLTGLITLDGNVGQDVLAQNQQFNQFLETRKMFAESALNTCRDKATLVWNEFKRTALIEIAQAQDEKIEEVKMSCVSTMSECYDSQTSALRSFDDTTAQATGALSARAAKAMCQDKVSACAALYGNGTECNFGNDGKLTTSKDACGLTALINFVNSVDNIRIAEGCNTALENYLKNMCTPAAGASKYGYPWLCRTLKESEINKAVDNFTKSNCEYKEDGEWKSEPTLSATVLRIKSDIKEQLDYQLQEICEGMDGYWVEYEDSGTTLPAFYREVAGGNITNIKSGRCVQNDTMVQCLAFNSDTEKSDTAIATYSETRDECAFSDEWYARQCTFLGNGYYENGICYVAKP